jgi:hypothetical protein
LNSSITLATFFLPLPAAIFFAIKHLWLLDRTLVNQFQPSQNSCQETSVDAPDLAY